MTRIKRVLVDRAVLHVPLTRIILSECAGIEQIEISSEEAAARLRGSLPEAYTLPNAKRIMLITRNPGSFFKTMNADPGVHDSARSESIRFDLFQGCPMDCRYCFCQIYLSCHHAVVFTNVEDAFTGPIPTNKTRLVTGDIADSLGLGKISILAHQYLSEIVPQNIRIELRSKCVLPDNWDILNPAQYRLDWSLTTPGQWRLNEPETASPVQRIKSAATAAKAGFCVGIRLDPIQPDRIERTSYFRLLTNLKRTMSPVAPDSFTIGSFKMSLALLEQIRTRFPGNPIPGYEWTRCPDGKVRPLKPVRIKSYTIVCDLLSEIFPGVPVEFSMEPAYVLNHFRSCMIKLTRDRQFPDDADNTVSKSESGSWHLRHL